MHFCMSFIDAKCFRAHFLALALQVVPFFLDLTFLPMIVSDPQFIPRKRQKKNWSIYARLPFPIQVTRVAMCSLCPSQRSESSSPGLGLSKISPELGSPDSEMPTFE